MKFVQQIRLAIALVLAFAFSAPALSAEMGGKDEPIKLAINEWTGQHITTHIAGQLLEKMGYKVEYITAGYIPQFSGLQDGSLAATLEIWESSIGDSPAKAVASGKVVDLGPIGLTPIEGWFYPDYVAEVCPGLPDWKALKDCADKFSEPETFPKGKLLDYPADWESHNNLRVDALGLEFSIVPAGSEGALIAELKAAVSKKKPLLMMFWSPHWVHADFPGKWVKFPDYEQACFDDPSWGQNPNQVRDCGFANNWIKKFAWVGLKDKWPAAHALLSSYQINNSSQEAMMKAVDVDSKDVKAVAKAWVDANEATWKPWIDAATSNLRQVQIILSEGSGEVLLSDHQSLACLRPLILLDNAGDSVAHFQCAWRAAQVHPP